jgi:hypothetical protein
MTKKFTHKLIITKKLMPYLLSLNFFKKLYNSVEKLTNLQTN